MEGEVDAKKKVGVDTSAVEIGLQALKERLKPFKGNVDAGNAEVIRAELEGLRAKLNSP